MDNTVLDIIAQIGTIPTLIMLILVVWFLLREIKKEVQGLRSDFDQKTAELKRDIQDLKEHSDDQDRKIMDELSSLDHRVSCVEKDCVTREEHYRDIGGWREEVRRNRIELRDDIRDFLQVIARQNGGNADETK